MLLAGDTLPGDGEGRRGRFTGGKHRRCKSVFERKCMREKGCKLIETLERSANTLLRAGS